MINKNTYNENNIFTFIFIILITLGIFFRFGNLGGKIVWHDEALTISRISGYYAKEIEQEIFNGEPISVKDLKKYQQKNPDRNILNIVEVLARDNPQHPPIYYLLLGLWTKFLGQSIVSIRSLSALFSSLVLLSIYIFWKELGQSSLVSKVSTAIIALSPVHILYAQEAREYSLWILLILVSSIFLLKAIKLKNKFIWSTYAFISLIGLYVFPFSLFVHIGHGIYIFILEKFRLTKILISFIIATCFVFSGFCPWLILIINKWSENGSTWTSIPIPFLALLRTWAKHIYNSFFLVSNNNSDYIILLYIFTVFFLVIITYFLGLLIKQTHISVWLFILILASTTFLPLAGADIIFGGQRSISTRYIIPSIVGVQLTLSFGLAYCLKSNKILIRKITQVLFITIIFIEIISCTISFQKNVAWNKGVSYNLPKIANIINNYSNSLLVSNSFGTNSGNLLALSHLLENNTSLILVKEWNDLDYQNIQKIHDLEKIFFLGVSKKFRDRIKQKYNVDFKTIYYDNFLHLEKISIDKNS